MEFILSLFPPELDISWPPTKMGLFVASFSWLVGFFLLIWLANNWSKYNKPRTRQFWFTFAILLALTPLTSLFMGIRLPENVDLPPAYIPLEGSALQPANLPLEISSPAGMLFVNLPWMLAAGLLGPAAAGVLAGVGGVFLALFETHRIFTPLEYALLAILFSAAINQRYRTWIYRAARRPFLVALGLAVLYPLIFLTTTVLGDPGTIAVRLDFGISRMWFTSIAHAGELLLAGLIAEIVVAAAPLRWGRHTTLEPSPIERNLGTRTMVVFGPLFIGLMLTLIAADWIVAGNAARRTLRDQMQQNAQLASNVVPLFLNVGASEITRIGSDPRLYQSSGGELRTLLGEYLRQAPFFTQLYLLGPGEPQVVLAGIPNRQINSPPSPKEELNKISLAWIGILHQHQSIPPANENDEAALISFVGAVKDPQGRVQAVLVGRTPLNVNTFSSPVLDNLRFVTNLGGQGMIIDEDGRILYHTSGAGVMNQYSGERYEDGRFFASTSTLGTRQYVYYEPVAGTDWAVILEVPAQRVQQVALDIAAPVLVTLVGLAFLVLILLRFGLRFLTGSLQQLTFQAEQIARGELDRPFTVQGHDEVGRLGQTFESMRLRLKARLDELNRLLLVTQGVAGSLEMEAAIAPVLDAARVYGASSARVVLLPKLMPEPEGNSSQPVAFGQGRSTELAANLDEQILNLTRQQERLVLTNLARTRLLQFSPGAPRPSALLAIALRHEGKAFGVLWTAYDEQHTFSAEEVNFMVTLSGQAALAAANARLYLMAESRRQRLAAILASTPDPVLVIDEQNCLLLANPAAWRVLGLGVEWEEGRPIETLITQTELLELLQARNDEKNSAEIVLNDTQVYFATATSVWADGNRVGRVCVLRDVTHFKELDLLKSEFVATVSHDLRSPLTLMRGYATMLDMVGELNEQQTGYVQKIVAGVETMSRLVNNLLDLGRIEAGVSLELEMVPIYELVERVTGALQLQATQKKIHLRTDLPPETHPLVEADQAFLQQALHNLIENAVKIYRTWRPGDSTRRATPGCGCYFCDRFRDWDLSG